MVLPAFGLSPTLHPQHPPQPPSTRPPLYISSLILQKLKKTITKTSSVSCVTELVIKLLYNYFTYAVNLASLQLAELGINEPEWLEYLKVVFLEI